MDELSEDLVLALIRDAQAALMSDDVEKAQVLSQLAMAASTTLDASLAAVEQRPGRPPRRARPGPRY